MKKLSIAKALKYHKPYTSKKGANISYKDLREMTSLNRKYSYEVSKGRIKHEQNARIKISRLNENYSSKLSRMRSKINLFKYIRIKNKLSSKSIKSPTSIARQRRILTKLKKEIVKDIPTITNTTLDNITDTTQIKTIDFAGLDIKKLETFRMNIETTFFRTFQGELNDETYNAVLDAIYNLSYSQLYSLSQDERIDGIISFMYNDPNELKRKLNEIIGTINRYADKEKGLNIDVNDDIWE